MFDPLSLAEFMALVRSAFDLLVGNVRIVAVVVRSNWSAAFECLVFNNIVAVIWSVLVVAVVASTVLTILAVATFEKYELVVDPGEMSFIQINVVGAGSVAVTALMAITGGDSLRITGTVLAAFWIATFVACTMHGTINRTTANRNMRIRSDFFTSLLLSLIFLIQ